MSTVWQTVQCDQAIYSAHLDCIRSFIRTLLDFISVTAILNIQLLKHIDSNKPEQNMDGESLRELRYRERERKAIETMRRQALLVIQEQREALVQARAEARARQDELDSQERRQRDVSSNVSAQRDDTLGTYISPISDSHKLDFAGKLYAPDDSLLTIDVAGSQYSVSPLAKSEKEIVIGEQRDVNTKGGV